jgi:hypothetical protein
MTRKSETEICKDAGSESAQSSEASRAPEIALIVTESLNQSELLREARVLPYAAVFFNPVQYIDQVLDDELGGANGANLLKTCADENGAINPDKLLSTLKRAYKRVIEILSSPSFVEFFRRNPIYTKDTLTKEYQKIFTEIAAKFYLAERFKEHIGIEAYSALVTTTVNAHLPARRDTRPMDVLSTDEKHNRERHQPKKRDTLSFGIKTEDEGHGHADQAPAVRGVGNRRQTLNWTDPSQRGVAKPAMPSARKITQPMGVTSGNQTARRSQMPLASAISTERVNPKLTTLTDFPANLPVQLPRSPNSQWPESDQWRSRSPRSLNSVIPPPPPISDIRELYHGDKNELLTLANVAENEFKQRFIHEYRIRAIYKGINGSIDQEVVSEAINAVLEAANKERASAKKAGFVKPAKLSAFRTCFMDKLEREDLDKALAEMAAKVVSELHQLKSAAHEEFKDEFVAAYEEKFPLDQGQGLKTPLFLPLVDALAKAVDRKMKSSKEEFENFKLYYPSGRPKHVKSGQMKKSRRMTLRQLALNIARQKALDAMSRLDLVLDSALELYTNKQTVIDAAESDMDLICQIISTSILNWLFKALPKEKGERSWLLYFFQGQKTLGEVKMEQADEMLQVLYNYIHETVETFVITLRIEAGVYNKTPQYATKERVDLSELIETAEAGDGNLDAITSDSSRPSLEQPILPTQALSTDSAHGFEAPPPSAEEPSSKDKQRSVNDADASITTAPAQESILPQQQKTVNCADTPITTAPAQESIPKASYQQTTSVMLAPQIASDVIYSVAVKEDKPPKPELDSETWRELELRGKVKCGNWTVEMTLAGVLYYLNGKIEYSDLRPAAGTPSEPEQLNLDYDDGIDDTASDLIPPQILGAESEIVQLKIPGADQAALIREFEQLVGVASSRLKMPLKSIPPEDNHGDLETLPLTPVESPHQKMFNEKAPDDVSTASTFTEDPREQSGAESLSRQSDTEAVKSPAKAQEPWYKRHWAKLAGGLALAASVTAGALGIYSVKSSDQTGEAPLIATALNSSGPKAGTKKAAETAKSAKIAKPTNPQPDLNKASPNFNDNEKPITQEMIAEIQNPELKKVMESGKITIKGNGLGYGQQFRALFDAEINYRLKAGMITVERAREMTKELDALQKKINTGAALSYYEKYKHLTYGQVYYKRANPAKDTLFAYLDRDIEKAGMGNWETWRDRYEPLTKMPAAREAKDYFEKNYEGAMLNFTPNPQFRYDQRAHNNIHWGARDGDIRLVRNEEGIWLPIFKAYAEIVLAHEPTVGIDLDADTLLDNPQTSHPAVNKSNFADPSPTIEPANKDTGTDNSGAPDKGGSDSKSGTTAILNNTHDPVIEVTGYEEIDEDHEIVVTWSDPEDPEITFGEEVEVDLSDMEEETPEPRPINASTVNAHFNAQSPSLSQTMENELAAIESGWFMPEQSAESVAAPEKPAPLTLEEKIDAIKTDREKALLERGEVFVPLLSDSMDGSVKMAYEYGFTKLCANVEQMNQVEAFVKNIKFSEMIEYEVVEDKNGAVIGTYAKLSPAKLAQIKNALKLEEAAKAVVNHAVYTPENPADAPEIELSMEEVDAGWLETMESIDAGNLNPMDARFEVRKKLAATVDGIISEA